MTKEEIDTALELADKISELSDGVNANVYGEALAYSIAALIAVISCDEKEAHGFRVNLDERLQVILAQAVAEFGGALKGAVH